MIRRALRTFSTKQDLAKLSEHDQIVQRRQKQGEYMTKKQKKDDSSMTHFIDHYSDQVVSMELFMDHTLVPCQHTGTYTSLSTQ